jgi:uroporphyrin-III C-methyltransferase / precorrin-2 dehydrogenase / sirohydrochlorin ferrochelatase
MTAQRIPLEFRHGSAAELGKTEGCVILVGAGPGDPELLTLKAVRALQTADAVLADDLVTPEILSYARPDAQIVLTGKKGHGPSCKQSDICALMVELARSGKRVVRLKGGDPMIFGRAQEEIAACRQAGIAIEIVPGISAAQGAASSLKVSLTQRGAARRLQYITGHGADGRLPEDLDLKSLGDPGTATALYMPVRTLAELAAAAAAAGVDTSVPAVAVSRATRPDEEVIAGTLAELPFLLAAEDMRGPVIVLIGRAFAECASAAAAQRLLTRHSNFETPQFSHPEYPP